MRHIDSSEISVVVQGAISDKFTKRVLVSIRKYLPKSEIILSTWKGSDVSDLDYDQLVLSKDPGTKILLNNNIPLNLNRQITSTLNGLRKATRKFALKIRTDIELTSDSFLNYFNKYNDYDYSYKFFQNRILMCEKYIRYSKYLCFHISDWVQFGYKDDLLKLWDIPLANEKKIVNYFAKHQLTSEHIWHIFKDFRRQYCAEQYIWIEFLKKYMHIDFKHMFDSTDENVQLTEDTFLNNILPLSEEQFGIKFLKYDTVNDFCYTYNDWGEMYVKKFGTKFEFINEKNKEMSELEKHQAADRKIFLSKGIPDLTNVIKPLERKNFINILLYQHLGDNFFRCALKEDIEKTFKAKTHFIIPKSNECLMKLFGISDYTLFDFNKFFNRVSRCFENKIVFEYFKGHYIEERFKSIPLKGKTCIISYTNENFKKVENRIKIDTMMKYAYAALGIDLHKKIQTSKLKYPCLNTTLRKNIENIAPLNKLILISPEANSGEMLNSQIWKFLTEQFIKRGFTVIENITSPRNHIKGAINLDLNLEDTIALAMECHSVFALRSGLCDVLVGKGTNLYIFMSEKRWRGAGEFFGFKENFEADSYPREFILSARKKPKIMWNGIDLGQGLKKEWMPDYIPFSKKVTTFFRKHPIIGIKVNRAGEIKKKKFYFFFMPIITTRKSPEKLTKKFLGLTFYKSMR